MLKKISDDKYLLSDCASVIDLPSLNDKDKIHSEADVTLEHLMIARSTALYAERTLGVNIDTYMLVTVELPNNKTLEVSIGAVNINNKKELVYSPYYS